MICKRFAGHLRERHCEEEPNCNDIQFMRVKDEGEKEELDSVEHSPNEVGRAEL